MNISAGTHSTDFKKLPDKSDNLIDNLKQPVIGVAQTGAGAYDVSLALVTVTVCIFVPVTLCIGKVADKAVGTYTAGICAVTLTVTGGSCYRYVIIMTCGLITKAIRSSIT